jgi:hypothetical protein
VIIGAVQGIGSSLNARFDTDCNPAQVAATRSSTIARAARRGGFSFGGLSFAGQARTNFYSFWQLLERIENIAQRTDATRVVKL